MMEALDSALTERLTTFINRKRLPVILQSEVAECGLACLAMVCGYHNYTTDLTTLRGRFPPSGKGVRLNDLMRQAQSLDLATRPLRVELDDLCNLHLPCILHWDFSHFVVLKKVSRGKVQIHDPAVGCRVLAFEELSKHFTGVCLELTPTSDFTERRETLRVSLTDFWNSISGLKQFIFQLILLSFLLEALALASPFYLQLVVDHVIVGSDQDMLVVLALGFLLLGIISCSVTVLRTWVSLHLGNQLSLQMGVKLKRRLVRLPVSWFERRNLGDIVSRFGSIEPIQNMLVSGFVTAVIDGVLAISTLVVMTMFSGTLTLIVMTGVLTLLIVRLVAYLPYRRIAAEALVVSAKQSTHFMETMRNSVSIKLANHELKRVSDWQNKTVDVMNVNIRQAKYDLVFSTIEGLIALITSIAVVYVSADMVMAGTYSIGMMFAFQAYQMRFSASMTELLNLMISFKMLDVHKERLADIVHAEPEQADIYCASARQCSNRSVKGKVTIEDLCYRYSDSDPEILSGVSLTINKGESVAIVGSSGSGKTTLLKIMAGLMQPTTGVVKIDGTPLNQLELGSYRSQIGVVNQNDSLLAGSIRENICMFADDMPQHQVEQAAKIACIHNEISEMPMGYQTLVGEMGSGLSGGQIQRLLIARAICAMPKVLYFDEASSSLDIANEKEINRNLARLNITRIFVAHRPNTIRSADRVIRIKDKTAIELKKTKQAKSRAAQQKVCAA